MTLLSFLTLRKRGRKPTRRWCRLQLEMLESRVVFNATTLLPPSGTLISWVGPLNGSSTSVPPLGGYWNDPLNWIANGVHRVPGAGDDVYIGELRAGESVKHVLSDEAIQSLTSWGSLVLRGGSIQVADYSYVADFTQTGGTLSVAGSADFGQATLFGGRLEIAGTSTATKLGLAGGAVSGAGDLYVYDTFKWFSGTISGGGSLVSYGDFFIDSASSLNLSSFLLLDNRTFYNYGNAFFSSGDVEVGNNAVFVNGYGASFDVQGDVDFDPTFLNEGTLLLHGSGLSDFDYIVTSGIVSLESGLLSVNSFTQTAGTTFFAGGALASVNTVYLSGGTLLSTMPATLYASLSNSGTISLGSAGTLAVSGAYYQGATGSLVVLIAGDDQYSKLSIGGSAALSGTLLVQLVDGYLPDSDDSYTPLTYGSRTGEFTGIQGIDLGTGPLFSVQYNPNNLTLTAQETNPLVVRDLLTELPGDVHLPPPPVFGGADLALQKQDSQTKLAIPLTMSPTLNASSGGGGQNTGVAVNSSALFSTRRTTTSDKAGDELEDKFFDRLKIVLDFQLDFGSDTLSVDDIASALLTGSRPDLLPQQGSRVAPVATLLGGDAPAPTTTPERSTEPSQLKDSLINPLRDFTPLEADGPRSQAEPTLPPALASASLLAASLVAGDLGRDARKIGTSPTNKPRRP